MHVKLSRGLLAASLALLLIVGAGCQKPKPQRTEIDASALVQSLSAAKQPDVAIANVKRSAAAGDRCTYAEAAARACLDADLHALVQPLLNAAPKTCKNGSVLKGEGAEALARAGDRDLAKQVANGVAATDPKNAYAELALARLAYDDNQMKLCNEHATKALDLGRGAEADRLIGRAQLALGDFKTAEAHYQAVLKANPNDTEAAFSAAVCNDRLGHYMAAREGFLQTLRIDPKHIEARKYLVLLTFRKGAKAEARHHLDKLAEVLPKDSPVLAELEAMLATGDADAGTPTKKN